MLRSTFSKSPVGDERNVNGGLVPGNKFGAVEPGMMTRFSAAPGQRGVYDVTWWR